jgi:hypothetical protein
MQLAHSPERALPGVVSEPSEQDGTQLVKASRQGDQDAFALPVQRHRRRVFTMVLRMLQDEEEASESTQEAFVAAWRGCHHSAARHALRPGSIASPTSVVCDSLNGASGRDRGTRSYRRNTSWRGWTRSSRLARSRPISSGPGIC